MTRPRAPWSLQRRLVTGIVALLTIMSVIVGAITVAVQHQDLLARLDQQVRAVPSFILEGGQPMQPNGDDPEGPQQRFGALIGTVSPDGTVTGQYTREDGTVAELTDEQEDLLTQEELSDDPITVNLGSDLGVFRIAERTTPDGDLIISGISLAELNTTVRNTALTFAAVTLAAILLAAAGANLIVRLALRPLGRIVTTARKVARRPLAEGTGEIPERVASTDSDPRTEVGEVGAALNVLLDSVQTALASRQESEDQLRRFVADASHELRTPLASIRGYAELSGRDATPMSETQSRAIERISAESMRMSSLVEDLLLLARLDAGQPLRHEQIDLLPLLGDAISDAWAADQDHVWELDADLEEESITVEGDPHRLHQVFANLLGNARKHTPLGTRVVVGASTAGRTAIITVTDDGPGIPPALLPHVFERFARGDDSRSRETGSSGLGLSIVSAIVEAQGGSVTAESDAEGATFTVRLPLTQPVTG